jgi:hypothetical protein
MVTSPIESSFMRSLYLCAERCVGNDDRKTPRTAPARTSKGMMSKRPFGSS